MFAQLRRNSFYPETNQVAAAISQTVVTAAVCEKPENGPIAGGTVLKTLRAEATPADGIPAALKAASSKAVSRTVAL